MKYRENGKICDKYIGKAGSTVDQLREQLELRKHYSDMLNALEQEQRAIHKLLEEIS